jgi:hypothetical protein
VVRCASSSFNNFESNFKTINVLRGLMHDISELIYILIVIFVEGCCVENFIWEMSVTWSNLVGESHKRLLP